MIFSLAALSCRKDDERKCETWKVEEWCEPKNSQSYCGSSTINEKPLCDESLQGASAGNVVMYREDSNVKYYRRFIQKM